METQIAAYRTVHGYMPVILHPRRIAWYTRVQRFPRKTKRTAAEALAYAEAVITMRAAFKRGRK